MPFCIVILLCGMLPDVQAPSYALQCHKVVPLELMDLFQQGSSLATQCKGTFMQRMECIETFWRRARGIHVPI